MSLPHDAFAERALLGTILASGAVPDVVRGYIRPDDIFTPELRLIAATCWAATEHIDIVSLRAALLKQGVRPPNQTVDPVWLSDLQSAAMPSPGYYAKEIRDLSVRRQIIAQATRAQQAAENPSEDGYDVAAWLSVEAASLAERSDPAAPSSAVPLVDFLAGPIDYDWQVPWLLERGDRLLITGGEGSGKALDITTPVPTPKGWTTMGELSVGDEVFSDDGSPVRVIAATEVMHDRPCYRVRFSDGAEIVADAQHLWRTYTVAAREAEVQYAKRGETRQPRGTDQRHKRVHFPAVVTTEHIAATQRVRTVNVANHSIPTCAPLQYPTQELPVDPYLLGAWLGDGTSRVAQLTCADQEIIDRIRSVGQSCERLFNGPYQWSLAQKELPHRERLQGRLRALGVLSNKHIPDAYLRASVEQRLALLQGLMDTDGTVSEAGGNGRGYGAATCEFSVCSELLARDVHELLLGLGIKVTFRTGDAVLRGRTVGTRYRLAFQTDLPVFHLSRKAERIGPLRTQRAKHRYIVSVEPVQSVPVRCIQVERPDGMFVVGRECIPTHNSVMIRQIAVCIAAGIHPFNGKRIDPQRVLLCDLENGERTLRRHLRSLVATVQKRGSTPISDGLMVESIPAGVDVTKVSGEAWLLKLCEDNKPDILVIGPLYRMHAGNMNDEEGARQLTRTIDAVRARFDCSVVMETHAPHGDSKTGARALRPVGSSLFMRWPEFGYGLRPVGDGTIMRWEAWRGARDERDWPDKLRRGGPGELPWMPYTGLVREPIDEEPPDDYDDRRYDR